MNRCFTIAYLAADGSGCRRLFQNGRLGEEVREFLNNQHHMGLLDFNTIIVFDGNETTPIPTRNPTAFLSTANPDTPHIPAQISAQAMLGELYSGGYPAQLSMYEYIVALSDTKDDDGTCDMQDVPPQHQWGYQIH